MPFKNVWIFKVLAVCVGLAVGLVVAELLLHASGIPYFHKAHSAASQFHFLKDKASGQFFYVNKPSSTITFRYDSNPRGYFKPGNVVDHVTNSWGFRGGELSPSKEPGTICLLFLGDSFTFGEGVHVEDTFAETTARLLPQRLGRENLKVEGYNLGVGGYNTADEVFLLKSIAPDLRPDAVILCYVLNDAEPSLFQVDSVCFAPFASSRRPCRRKHWTNRSSPRLCSTTHWSPNWSGALPGLGAAPGRPRRTTIHYTIRTPEIGR